METKKLLKKVSIFLVLTLAVQDLLWANPEIAYSGQGTENSIQRTGYRKELFEIPESWGTIEQVYHSSSPCRRGSGLDSRFCGNDKLIYLIQDAHTNESAQRNIAKILDRLTEKEKIKYVFLEAGTGDDSLSDLRPLGSAETRRAAGERYLRKAWVQGPDYLDLTSEQNFKLWGVEDKTLYFQGIDLYRSILKRRENANAALDKTRRTINFLKSRQFSPYLLEFDKKRDAFSKNELPLSDYFEELLIQTRRENLSLLGYPNVLSLKEVKEKEARVDFKKANEEQQAVLNAFPAQTRRVFTEILRGKDMQKAGADNVRQLCDIYAALEEAIRAKNIAGMTYPNLPAYFDYLKALRRLEFQALVDEIHDLESRIYDSKVSTEEERKLLEISRSEETLRRIVNFSALSSDLKEIISDPARFDVIEIGGYLNRQIMGLETRYEDVIFLSDDFEKAFRDAQAFYGLTEKRDEVFIQNILSKMDAEKVNQAAFVTGGFHADHLKKLLREKNISYVSILPAVTRETNHKRYESLLLGQAQGMPAVSMGFAVKPSAKLWAITPAAQFVPPGGLETAKKRIEGELGTGISVQRTAYSVQKKSGARLSKETSNLSDRLIAKLEKRHRNLLRILRSVNERHLSVKNLKMVTFMFLLARIVKRFLLTLDVDLPVHRKGTRPILLVGTTENLAAAKSNLETQEKGKPDPGNFSGIFQLDLTRLLNRKDPDSIERMFMDSSPRGASGQGSRLAGKFRMPKGAESEHTRQILDFLIKNKNRKVTANDLANELGFTWDHPVRAVLDRLVAQGLVDRHIGFTGKKKKVRIYGLSQNGRHLVSGNMAYKARVEALGFAMDPNDPGSIKNLEGYEREPLSYRLILVPYGQTPANVDLLFQDSFRDGGFNQILTPEGEAAVKSGAEEFWNMYRDEILRNPEKFVFLQPPLLATHQTVELYFKKMEEEWKKNTKKRFPFRLKIDRDTKDISHGSLRDRAAEEAPDADRDAATAYRTGDFFVRPKDGENRIMLMERARRWILRNNKRHAGKTVVLFGHGTFQNAVEAILRTYPGKTPKEIFTRAKGVSHLKRGFPHAVYTRGAWLAGGAQTSRYRKENSQLISRIKKDFVELSGIADAWAEAPFVVAHFGSARIPSGHFLYQDQVEFGEMMWQQKMVPITGAGPSMMEAVLKGYKQYRDAAGVKAENSNSTRGALILGLSKEKPNHYVELLVSVNHFMSRKFAFQGAEGAVIWPGGFGTMDEAFEFWRRGIPVVFYGKEYWGPILNGFEKSAGSAKTLSQIRGRRPYLITNSKTDAIEYLKKEAGKRAAFPMTKTRLEAIKEEVERVLAGVSEMERAVTFVGNPGTKREINRVLEVARALAMRSDGMGPVPVRVASRGKLFDAMFIKAKKDGWLDRLQVVLFIKDGDQKTKHEIEFERSVPNNFISTYDESAHQLALTNNSHAYIFVPGGVGTMNKLFDIVTIMQTKKSRRKPIFFMDGGTFKPFFEAIRNQMLEEYGERHWTLNHAQLSKVSVIKESDLDLIRRESNPKKIVAGLEAYLREEEEALPSGARLGENGSQVPDPYALLPVSDLKPVSSLQSSPWFPKFQALLLGIAMSFQLSTAQAMPIQLEPGRPSTVLTVERQGNEVMARSGSSEFARVSLVDNRKQRTAHNVGETVNGAEKMPDSYSLLPTTAKTKSLQDTLLEFNEKTGAVSGFLDLRNVDTSRHLILEVDLGLVENASSAHAGEMIADLKKLMKHPDARNVLLVAYGEGSAKSDEVFAKGIPAEFSGAKRARIGRLGHFQTGMTNVPIQALGPKDQTDFSVLSRLAIHEARLPDYKNIPDYILNAHSTLAQHRLASEDLASALRGDLEKLGLVLILPMLQNVMAGVRFADLRRRMAEQAA